MSITLHSCARDAITLEVAIATLNTSTSLDGSLALLYSPSHCHLALIDNGQLQSASGTLDPNHYFEARIFSPSYELRWLNQTNGQGRAVYLSEQPLTWGEPLLPLEALDSLSQQYLLWGKGLDAAATSGWGTLATPRIGGLTVPLSGISQNAHVVLHSREYLGTVDTFGNVAVIEERLTHLEVQ